VDTDIKRLLREMEVLGEKGEIEASEKLNEEVESLKRTKEDLYLVALNQNLAAKQMKICDVCGAKQSVNDLEKRNLSHLDGKLHVGFQTIRTEYDNLKKRLEMVELNIEVQKEEMKRSGRNTEKEINDFNTFYEARRERLPERLHKGEDDDAYLDWEEGMAIKKEAPRSDQPGGERRPEGGEARRGGEGFRNDRPPRHQDERWEAFNRRGPDRGGNDRRGEWRRDDGNRGRERDRHGDTEVGQYKNRDRHHEEERPLPRPRDAPEVRDEKGKAPATSHPSDSYRGPPGRDNRDLRRYPDREREREADRDHDRHHAPRKDYPDSDDRRPNRSDYRSEGRDRFHNDRPDDRRSQPRDFDRDNRPSRPRDREY
jgi:hypothetical protein